MLPSSQILVVSNNHKRRFIGHTKTAQKLHAIAGLLGQSDLPSPVQDKELSGGRSLHRDSIEVIQDRIQTKNEDVRISRTQRHHFRQGGVEYVQSTISRIFLSLGQQSRCKRKN